MTYAYYNEFDPKAAAWLRELIKRGLIADGEVDERSIVDVRPVELKGFTQCHFFAGIGVWSHALRQAGWSDDRPVWTGSCPCQGFSAAGQQRGFDDERHLWPVWFELIRECRPSVIFGEQVSSSLIVGKSGKEPTAGQLDAAVVDGESRTTWLGLVQSDLEGSHYAFWASDLPAAGLGSPHIRQRLWFVAEGLDDAAGARHEWPVKDAEGLARDEARLRMPDTGCADSRLADSVGAGLEGYGWDGDDSHEPGRLNARQDGSAATEGGAGGLGDADNSEREAWEPVAIGDETRSERPTQSNAHGRLADAECDGLDRSGNAGSGGRDEPADSSAVGEQPSTGPTNGYWRAADWLFCRDGKWRPVVAAPQPLADGSASDLVRVCDSRGGYFFPLEEKAPARVMRLKGYGNAIVAPVAQAFIEAYLESQTPEC
jgi:DNA (cytosine-5)-methyltransferase 1